MTLMLLRTIRLDPSDGFVFTRAAEPGEWAVPGSFLFWRTDPADLAGKERAAFRSGFLGITSFGWSTLAVTAEASEAELAEATRCLARQLETRLGAPSAAAAGAAAAEELAFARSLARHAPGTLVALHRELEGGEIRERFRTLRRREPGAPDRVFSPIPEEDGADGIDLVELARAR